MKKTIKGLLFVFFCVLAFSGFASDRLCNGVGVERAYQSVEVRGVAACFVYVETPVEKQGQLSRDPDGIAMYSMSGAKSLTLVYEFPYAGTKGKINDVFALPVGGLSEELLFVIHSVESPRFWDATSDIYDVAVIRVEDGRFVMDEKLSRFFSLGADLDGAQEISSYSYPYKEKSKVEAVVRSPLFDFVYASVPVVGVVQEKSFLYGGDVEPSVQDPKRMYLIKGDNVVLEDSTAGWCKVSYSGGREEVKRWMQCKSVIFSRG